MFADYISDSSWANRSHRGWTALASFAAQALAVAGLLALPLFYTQALPRLALLGTLIAPEPPPAPTATRAAQSQVVSSLGEHALRFPTPIPRASSTSGTHDADAFFQNSQPGREFRAPPAITPAETPYSTRLVQSRTR